MQINMGNITRDTGLLFAKPRMSVTQRADGAVLLESPHILEDYGRCIGDDLERWARLEPERLFLQERDATGQWTGLTYAQALTQVHRIAAWLLKDGRSGPDHPVVVLSDNSIEHALLMLACLHVGIPYSALSPAYSLVSQDHAKLKTLITLLDPGLIYVADPVRYAAALASIRDLHTAPLVISGYSIPSVGQPASASSPDMLPFADLLSYADDEAVADAYAQVGPDTVAKILFTSGSTGDPKGVINTQRMLCAPQQGLAQLWPFMKDSPPILLDWLPWNHTFGGNHNFNLILKNGGTLYLDSGKPMPGMFDASLRNLQDVSPSLYLNVPRAFDMLVPALRADRELRRKFFSRLQIIFYAAAALPQTLWDALIELSTEELGHPVPMVTSWGSTETAPLATHCNYQAARSGVIGLPIPGVQLKLLPNGEKLEVRVKGPNVTPGYYKQPELTQTAFDDDGFYRIGDAVRFVDSDQPELGLLFDGRVAEDFKLSSGTWVNTGKLRVGGIEALAPIVQDIVITGHDRDFVGFLIFPNAAACRQLAGLAPDTPMTDVVSHPVVRSHIEKGMMAMKRNWAGTSNYPQRAIVMTDAPSVDGNEITDKGYINQAAVLRRRAQLVDRIHAAVPDADVIALS
ncbi:feruloyl-CoA synthase [Noviherbaspirillum sp.]|jgi:feruloyl-CoA synthase|uniref:feruloyl-CoA synthase n=1 Tax=Noviherbaspirillum sp. TaxID=1926288 RepID=UPI002DDCE494|nr:feruloyl-CoA synthase [Noviherbaspirillum sp.]